MKKNKDEKYFLIYKDEEDERLSSDEFIVHGPMTWDKAAQRCKDLYSDCRIAAKIAENIPIKTIIEVQREVSE